MIRILLKALNPFFLCVVIAFGIALQTSIFYTYPLTLLQPDIVLLAVIWVSLKRDFTEGGILTLIMGNIAEINSSAPQGILMASYLLVFFSVRLAAKLLVIPNRNALVFVTLASSLFWKLTYFGLLLLLGVGFQQWKHLITLLFPGAVSSGFLGIWFFRFLDRFDWITFKNRKAEQALEDEILLGYE